jgi:hypothetical protein
MANTRRSSATSVHFLTSLPAEPGCSLSSHPTTSTQLVAGGRFKIWTIYISSIGPRSDAVSPFFRPDHRDRQEPKKTDVAEHPRVMRHIGLLFNKPPGATRLIFIQSSETRSRRGLLPLSPTFSILGHPVDKTSARSRNCQR